MNWIFLFRFFSFFCLLVLHFFLPCWPFFLNWIVRTVIRLCGEKWQRRVNDLEEKSCCRYCWCTRSRVWLDNVTSLCQPFHSLFRCSLLLQFHAFYVLALMKERTSLSSELFSLPSQFYLFSPLNLRSRVTLKIVRVIFSLLLSLSFLFVPVARKRHRIMKNGTCVRGNGRSNEYEKFIYFLFFIHKTPMNSILMQKLLSDDETAKNENLLNWKSALCRRACVEQAI